MILRKLRAEGGFCLGGCILFAAVVLLIVGAVVWGAYSTYQGAYLMTSPRPREFGPIPSAAEQNAARLKWRALGDALQKGNESEFKFTADDLNAWFFADGNNADLIPHLRFRTTDDWIVAEVSVPLSFMADIPTLPSLRNRFFNGKIAARLTIEKSELKITSLDLEGNGHRLPWLFTGQGYRDTVTQTLDQGIRARLPHGDLFLSRLDSIRVENAQIIVRFRGGNGT
ncbi:MAG: hypothetical protein JO313_04670 [Verrucomicrobia bacterium]|nr:hypothetical protein [Verrucomicrobiota bacterium]MBV9129731.1 hypothetical protein [Verrucomicrobiota bacterium]